MIKNLLLLLILAACTFNVGQPDFYILETTQKLNAKGYLAAGRSATKKNKNEAIKKAEKLAQDELRYEIKQKLYPIANRIISKITFEKGINRYDIENIIIELISLKLMQRSNTSYKKLKIVPKGYRCSCVAFVKPKRMYKSIDEELKTGEKAVLRYLQNNKIDKGKLKQIRKYFE